MIKQLLFLIIILYSFSCFAQNKLNTYHDSIQLSNQKNEMDLLRKNVDLTNNLIATGNSSIANQLSASNNAIALFGVMIAISLIGLGIYFARIDNRVREIENRTSKKLNEIEQIEQRVQQVQSDINNNIGKIFNDLQTQELNYLLLQIEDTPILFHVLESKLMGLNISESYFDRFYVLKGPINKVFSRGNGIDSIQYAFLSVMFYHFPIKMILTSDYNRLVLRYGGQKRRIEIIEFILEYSKRQELPHRFERIKALLGSMEPGSKYFDDLVSLLKTDEIGQMVITPSHPDGKVPEHHIPRNDYFNKMLESCTI